MSEGGDTHCGATFDDLFESSVADEIVDQVAGVPSPPRIASLNPLSDERCCCPILYPFERSTQRRKLRALGYDLERFREMIPNTAQRLRLRTDLSARLPDLPRRTLGIHARINHPTLRFSSYAACYESLQRVMPELDRFEAVYLATDNPEFRAYFLSRFDALPVVHASHPLGLNDLDRRSATDVQNAAIDLFALTRCAFVVGSVAQSTFLDLAMRGYLVPGQRVIAARRSRSGRRLPSNDPLFKGRVA